MRTQTMNLMTSNISTTQRRRNGVSFDSSPSWAFSTEKCGADIPQDRCKENPAEVVNPAREDGAR